MSRFLAASLFFILLYATLLDVSLSLAPGLSVKNAFLYLMVGYLMVRTIVEDHAISPLDQPIPFLSLHLSFIALILWSVSSWLYMSFFATHIEYNLFYGLIQLKGRIVDLYLILAAYFFILRTKEEVIWTIRAIIFMVAIYNLVTFVDAFNIVDLGLIGDIGGNKDWPLIGHANEYGAFIAFFLPTMVALALTSTGVSRAICVIGAVLSLILLVATFARAAYVGIVLSAVIAGYIYRKQFPPSTYIRYAVVAVFATVILSIVSGQWEDFYDRIIGFTARGGTANEISSGRLGIWTAALTRQLESVPALIFGVGWDAYDQSAWFYYAPHNTYLKYLFELGILGLLIVMLLMKRPLSIVASEVNRATDSELRLLVSFGVGYLSFVIFLFFSNASTTNLYMWAYVGLVMRLVYLIKCPGQNENTDQRVR